MRTIAIAAAVLMVSSTVNGLTIGTTLAECKAVASMFRNTCTEAPNGPATWGNTFQGASVSCTQSKCPDNQSGTSCTWTRRLCVSCSQVGPDVFIRVQTNGLPDHCFNSPQSTLSQKSDITVKFNPSVATLRTFASQSAFDSAVCTPQKASTIPSESSFSYTSGVTSNIDLTTASGIALNGVIILASASLNNIDPFYPRWWTGATSTSSELVDACLAHPQASGIYHYHILPPCLVDSVNFDGSKPCAQTQSCISDLRGYALSAYENFKQEKILGIAKDGHFILGPYKDDGTLYDCTQGFDQCSGTHSSDGSYVYIFQNKYPYINDCFGPAPVKTYQASCSTNTCIPQSFAGFLQAMPMIVLAALSAFFML